MQPKKPALEHQRLDMLGRSKPRLGSKAKNTSQVLVIEPPDQEKYYKNLPSSLRSTPKG